MRRPKNTESCLIAIAAIFLVIFGAGYIGLKMYNWNNMKPRISKVLEEATGRRAAIRGNVVLKVGLSPIIAIEDISVHNAEWGSKSEMLSIPLAEVKINLLSLLYERTEVERIFIRKPTLFMETGKSGKLNLQPVAKGERAQGARGFFVRRVLIENGDFAFRDQKLGKTFRGDLKTFRADADSFQSPLRIVALGTYSDREFIIRGDAGSQAGILTGKTDWRVEISAEIGDASGKIQGTVPKKTSKEPGSLKFTVEGNDLSRMMALLGMSVRNKEAFNAKGTIVQAREEKIHRIALIGKIGDMNFTVDGDFPAFASLEGMKANVSVRGPKYSELSDLFGVSARVESPFDLKGEFNYSGSDRRWRGKIKGSVGKMDVDINGNMPGLTSFKGLESQIAGKGPDFSKFLALFTLSTPLKEAFDVSTEFAYPDAQTFHLNETRAIVGESDYTGIIRVDAKKRPRIEIDGRSKRLDLVSSPYLKQIRSERSEIKETESNRKNGRAIPDRPINLKPFEGIDVDAELKAEELLLPYFFLTDFETELTLGEGHLRIGDLRTGVGSGYLNGRAEVKFDSNPPFFNAAIDAEDIEMDQILRGVDPIKKVLGDMNISFEASSRGRTYAELAAVISGKARFAMSDGRIRSQALHLLGSNLFSALIEVLNPFDEEREYVDIGCMAASFLLEDGVAETPGIVLNTPDVAVLGDGKINLKEQEIEIFIKTISKKDKEIQNNAGEILSVGSYLDQIQIEGPLSNPKAKLSVSNERFSSGKAPGSVALFSSETIASIIRARKDRKRNVCSEVIEKAEAAEKDREADNRSRSPR